MLVLNPNSPLLMLHIKFSCQFLELLSPPFLVDCKLEPLLQLSLLGLSGIYCVLKSQQSNLHLTETGLELSQYPHARLDLIIHFGNLCK